MVTAQCTALVLKASGKECRIPVQVSLSYDGENDPFAVQMIVTQADGEVCWTFSYDTLREAMNSTEKTGAGDVKFKTWPHFKPVVDGYRWHTGGLVVCLKNLDGHADLGLPIHVVNGFLGAAVAEEPDDDHLDEIIDEALKELLEG